MVNDMILNFVDELLKEAGFSGSLEKHMEYKESLLALVQQRLGGEIMKLMNADQLNSYVDLVETKPNAEQLSDFFDKNIPDLDQKVQGILAGFKKDFVNILSSLAK
ncbi:MAG: hypothetical protein UR94_C0024G0002 [Parcubacteria group bacterium GW2011_GWA2_36_10]|nr:MAG: hypothetical protein UR94_C0024G0002 [Parcubacteria group bacterium GW2011_GWA2_36_10]